MQVDLFLWFEHGVPFEYFIIEEPDLAALGHPSIVYGTCIAMHPADYSYWNSPGASPERLKRMLQRFQRVDKWYYKSLTNGF
jgi:hypothetical protein